MTIAVQLAVTGGEVAVGRREGVKNRNEDERYRDCFDDWLEESRIQANFWRATSAEARRDGEKLAMPRGVVPLLPRGANASP